MIPEDDFHLINLSGDPPGQNAIGTSTVFKKKYPFKNVLQKVGYQRSVYGLCLCQNTTETGRDGEKMFILGQGHWWYACEGTTAEGRAQIRQACFCTREAFFEASNHNWAMNKGRDTKAEVTWQNCYDGEWSGELMCETRVPEVRARISDQSTEATVHRMHWMHPPGSEHQPSIWVCSTGLASPLKCSVTAL